MTGSGSSQLPPGPPPGPATYPAARDVKNARIEDLPPQLRVVEKPVKIEGEVVRVDADTGRVRIRTDRGDVTVVIRDKTELPAEGARVEITLPAGRPPKSAHVAPAPPPPPVVSTPQPPVPGSAPVRPPQQQPPVTTAPAPPRPDAPQPDIPVQPGRPSAEPQPQIPARPFNAILIAQPDIPYAPAAQGAPRPPAPGDIVRLTPLSHAGAAAIILPQADEIVPATLAPLAARIGIAAEIIERGTIQTKPETPASSLPLSLDPSPPIAGEREGNRVSGRVEGEITLSSKILPAAAAAGTPNIIVPEKISVLPASAVPVQTPAQIQTQIVTPSLPAPVSPLPAAAAQMPLTARITKPETIDARVTEITPPPVQFTSKPTLPLSLDPPSPQAGEKEGIRVSGKGEGEAIHPPKALSAPEILKPHHAGQITAHVVGVTPEKLPVVLFQPPGTAAPQLFTLHVAPDVLPLHTELRLVPLPHVPAQTAIPANMPPLFEFLPGTPWPAMDELLQAIQQYAPQAVTETIARATPNPSAPARIPAAALLFIAAVRAGDIGGWLGERTIDTLRRAGKADVIERAGRSLANLSRLSAEPVSQDWRAMSIPLFYENEIQKMMLYYRHDGGRQGDEEDGKKSKTTRFIFDLALPRMGAVQIDGFHNINKLDVIVRTKTMLGPGMQQAMRRKYVNALEVAGLKGELAFQGKAEQFVKIQPDKHVSSSEL